MGTFELYCEKEHNFGIVVERTILGVHVVKKNIALLHP